MKKKYVITVFLIILLGMAVLLGLIKFKSIKEDIPLRNSIIKTIEESNEIDFTKITDFQWDTMYIFTPYSNPKDILKNDGISASNSKFNIEMLDNINMIGFVSSNKLVTFVELPRSYGGENLTNYTKYSKDKTKFDISQDKKAIVFNKN